MMLFRVAEIVGSTVADLHFKITPHEFEGWVTYINTKGPDVAEVQMAILTNLVASGLGAKGSKVNDYLLSGKIATPKKDNTAFASFNNIATEYKGPQS